MLNNITITHHKGGALISKAGILCFSKVSVVSDYTIKLPHEYKLLPIWVVNSIIDHERGHALHGDLERKVSHSVRQRLVQEVRADGYAAAIHGPVLVFLAMILACVAESIPRVKKTIPIGSIVLLSPILLVVWMFTSIRAIIGMLTYSTNVRIWQLLIPRKKGYYDRFKESEVKINKLISLKYKRLKIKIVGKTDYIKCIDDVIVATQRCIDCGLEHGELLKEELAKRDRLMKEVEILQSIEYTYS